MSGEINHKSIETVAVESWERVHSHCFLFRIAEKSSLLTKRKPFGKAFSQLREIDDSNENLVELN